MQASVSLSQTLRIPTVAKLGAFKFLLPFICIITVRSLIRLFPCNVTPHRDVCLSAKQCKRDDYVFEIVNFQFLDGDVPRSTSSGVYISQLIRFASESSHVTDFNTRNKLLTQKNFKQGYQNYKLRKTFSTFIDVTSILYLNSKLGLKLSYVKDFRNLSYMVTCCIN